MSRRGLAEAPGGDATAAARSALEGSLPHGLRGRFAEDVYLLLNAADPGASLAQRLDWIRQVVRWVRSSRRGRGADQAANARLRILVEVLSEVRGWGRNVGAVMASVLTDTSALAFFCDTGTGRLGFVGEAVHRFSRKVLPRAADDEELSELVSSLFPHAADAAWLEQLPSELVSAMAQCVAEAPNGKRAAAVLRRVLGQSLQVLALRVAARGMAEDIRGHASGRRSPFLRLTPACDALLAGGRRPGRRRAAARAELDDAISGCRRAIAAVYADLDQRGVSVDLVYRLDLLARNLGRMTTLAALLAPLPADDGSAARRGTDLAASLVREQVETASLRALVRTNARQLARKIIERAGHTGEHYITSTRREYWLMLASAGGGGVLTAGTAALKYVIGGAALPPLFEMLLLVANYAGSFLLMQALGFTLATKQPSVTAAALAGALSQSGGAKQVEPLSTLVARITRSQFAAAVGNVGMVIPAAILLDTVVRLKLGRHVLDAHTAEHVVHSLHPWHSSVLPFAVLTGVFLWLSSIAAGWLENWAVYRRLPEALARSRRLVGVLGPERAARLSAAFARNVSGIGGNTTLGTLLGITPSIGRFVGLPLQTPHVTLSTGALVLGCSTLGWHHAREAGALPAMLGVACIGLLNFGVSFALALQVALRARDVKQDGQLLRAVLRRIARAPLEFIGPPAGAARRVQV